MQPYTSATLSDRIRLCDGPLGSIPSTQFVQKCLGFGGPFDFKRQQDSDLGRNGLSPVCLATKLHHRDTHSSAGAQRKPKLWLQGLYISTYLTYIAYSVIYRTLLNFGASPSLVFRLALLVGNTNLAKMVLRDCGTLEEQQTDGIRTLGIMVSGGGLELVHFLMSCIRTRGITGWEV